MDPNHSELKRWHAVYTRARNEKRLVDRLGEKGIEAYTPLRKVLKQWSDRKKWVEEPLIPSYVFVHIDPEDYLPVLNTQGAVRYVFFSGKAATIPENQVETLKRLMHSQEEVALMPATFAPGSPVVITSGPLAGIEGELVRIAGKNKVILRIDQIDQVLSISISPSILESRS